MTKPVYGEKEAGCWFDCSRGIYIGEKVIDTAIDHGWVPLNEEGKPYAGTITVDAEWYHELWDEAEEFMQQFAAEGYSFGTSEWGGDWGLWQHEEEGN